MKHLIFFLLGCLVTINGISQHYTSARVFAHNDYVRAKPFYTAYELEVGFIEADVFLKDGDLMVAHHAHEIEKGKTLEKLYLKPLEKQIRKNDGLVYPHPAQKLTLMIDLKTDGDSTLQKLVQQLEQYPALLRCPTLQFMISGSVPEPGRWKHYPSFIHFDGRPEMVYTPGQLKRISMISTNFRAHTNWDGKGSVSTADSLAIRSLMDQAHQHGKLFRCWATPDFENAWKEQMRLNMDVIVTDQVTRLVNFLQSQP